MIVAQKRLQLNFWRLQQSKIRSVQALALNDFSTSAATGHQSLTLLWCDLGPLVLQSLPQFGDCSGFLSHNFVTKIFSRDFQSGLDQDSGLAFSLFQCFQLRGTALPVLQSEGTLSCMKIAGWLGDEHGGNRMLSREVLINVCIHSAI